MKAQANDFQLPQWFLRMPYDIHLASDVCHNRISQMLENIEAAANSQEDIITN